MGPVLNIIMDSNESKLGADGLPIYNADGKVLKGPNYWKPEPALRKMLEEYANGRPTMEPEEPLPVEAVPFKGELEHHTHIDVPTAGSVHLHIHFPRGEVA